MMASPGILDRGTTLQNVIQAVPFFMVAEMEKSLAFYVEGLGFSVTKTWEPDGRIRWCWVELGGAALMLQEYLAGSQPDARPGVGVSICFQCKDAVTLYLEFLNRRLEPQKPFVGNAMWVTAITDPDGYKLNFESPTNAPEESTYQGESEENGASKSL